MKNNEIKYLISNDGEIYNMQNFMDGCGFLLEEDNVVNYMINTMSEMTLDEIYESINSIEEFYSETGPYRDYYSGEYTSSYMDLYGPDCLDSDYSYNQLKELRDNIETGHVINLKYLDDDYLKLFIEYIKWEMENGDNPQNGKILYFNNKENIIHDYK